MKSLQLLALLSVSALLLGCPPPSANEEKSNKSSEPGEQKSNSPFNESRVAGSAGIVGKMSDEVHDYEKLSKDPKWRIAPKATGSSTYGKAYFSAITVAAKSQHRNLMAGWQSDHNFKNPTFEEYTDPNNRLRVKLPKLPAWHRYAYNEKDGQLYIFFNEELQKKELKKQDMY